MKSGKTQFVKKIMVLIALIAIVACYILITKPVQIHKDVSAVRFVKDQPQNHTVISMRIQGLVEKKWTGKPNVFTGSISIDGEELKYLNPPLSFNSDGMVDMYNGSAHYGMMFVEGNMDKIAIEIHERQSDGVYSANGTYIASPCETRQQGVEIVNSIISKVLTGFKIN